MMPKDLWKSKTIWFNVLALIIAVTNGFGFADFTADPRIAQLAAGLVALLAIIDPIVNMLLRLLTKQPVVLKRR